MAWVAWVGTRCAKAQSSRGLTALSSFCSFSLTRRPVYTALSIALYHNQWLGSYRGDGQSVTPHLDRLAKSGARFANAYAAASTCAPSR